jgi:hypothetical protein
MKHSKRFYCHAFLLCAFASLNLSLSAQLFEPSSSEVRAITVDESKTVGISIDLTVFEELRKSYPEEFILVLPDFNGGEVQLHLERFEPFPATIKVGIHSDRGYEELDYVPRIKTYKVTGGTGSFVLMTDYVLGTFQHNGMQIEVKPIDDKATDGEHVLFDVNNLIVGRDFECAMEEVGTGDGHKVRELVERSEKSLSGCAEIAVDIDSYTYSTFGDVLSATDWALALMTAVSQIYTQELGDLVFLQTTYVHIWQTADPMSNYTNQAGEMLDIFRSTWQNDPVLSSIQRDETHLLTKRNDTGTGGIAYLDVVCSSYAYGFSSALSGTTNYNISSWTWNLMVVAHELGHNLGSNHTQSCVWPGGPIDNCVSPEGGCSYEGGTVTEGTIMSYCHTNGSVPNVLNFHPTVQLYGLQPSINNNGSCFGGCEGYVAPECAILDISSGSQLACNPLTNTYTQHLVISYENTPSSGFFNVNGTLHAINNSPQIISLANTPGNSETVDVEIFVTTEETCSAYAINCYTQRDPCCALVRLQYVNPNSNVIKVKNTSDCGGDISEWGFYANGIYNSFNELSGSQNLYLEAGAEVQLAWSSWDADETFGELQLYGPTNVLMDYIQWGDSGSLNESVSSSLGFWEPGTFVNSLPPFEYVGEGIHGYEFWTGADIPCDILNVEVDSYTSCNPATGNYSVSFTVDYTGAPESGGFSVNGNSIVLQESGSTYVLDTPSTGAWLNLDVSFENEAVCSFFLGNAVFGPSSCNVSQGCPTDLNGDGNITVADVLAILSEFGCSLNCSFDVDGDNAITVSDVLVVLSTFGDLCE